MTPDEISEYITKKFKKDLKVFERLIKEQEEKNNWLRNQETVKPLLGTVKNFYEDLISDGYIKKDFSLFEHDKLAMWKLSQSRGEVITLLKELDQSKYKDYHEIFQKWNRAYANTYELLINEYLIEPAENIYRKRISNKGFVVNILSSYKNGKYSNLFRNIIPQIRNSIQHTDSIIDPKQPKITFYDRNKPPLPLTIEEYANIFWGSFFLTLAFDVQDFDLRLGIVRILLEEIDIVDNFIKKSESGLSLDEKSLSILDLALLIKSGKIK